MTIRLKILLGCFALTLLTALVGGSAREAQRNLGSVTMRLYDEAFQAMSYLRSAQNGLTRAEAELRKAAAPGARPAEERSARTALAGALPEIAENLQVARDRARSEQARAVAARLATTLGTLADAAPAADRNRVLSLLAEAEGEFDTAVEVYAADGFRHRQEAGDMVERAVFKTWAATGLSVLVAVAITAVLGRSIVPAIREAVGVAQAIAAGRLDNRIEAGGGRGETARLLCALAAMQSSIAAAMARIQALMEEQASSHAGEIAAQHARFDAALSNMSQGLCLFDAGGKLAVANRRFAEMFGAPEPGAAPERVFADGGLAGLLGAEAGEEAGFSCDLPDGRVVAVAHRPVAGGGWVATYEDVTERRRAEERLAHMAHHDALTGLPNRVLFREHTRRALARARRGGGLAVMCLDLDRFKPVNDTLGHPVGDALLRAVADRLRACAREADLVARLGGDEFAVVQEAASSQPADATGLARRLVEALAAPFEVEGHQVVVGASVGVALVVDAPDDADSLLKCADLALYRAKADGRGTWRFFEAGMDARMQARRALEMDLRRALADGQLEVFYQPLVEAGRGGVSGFEALLRWRHPARGMVPPAAFIPLAEEIGLIGPIGIWALRQACAAVASWPGDLKVAVNLSAAQFRDRALADEVARALADTGLHPARLELEVTESLLLADDEGVLAMLHELRALGVRIAMDDFGTGYSSLSYLRRFPFDKIKIDQSFVRGLGEREDCAAIVRAVVGLGRALGMAVNAEGVETAEQFAALRAEGCGEVQGYLFSKPLPAAEIPALLRRRGALRDPDGPGGTRPGALPEPVEST